VSIRLIAAVWDQADAAGGELLVLLAMADWANDEGRRCFPTQDALARKARMTDRGVRKCLDRLVEKGYIERIGRLGGGPVEWAVHPRPEHRSDRNPSSGQTGTPVPTEPLGIHQEKDVSNETSSSSALAKPSRPTSKTADSNDKRMVPPGSCAVNRRTSPEVILFDYWRTQCGHPKALLTRDRVTKVLARLREGYSVEDIRRAIDGAAKHAYVNDRGVRYDDLELICRSGSKLEGFIQRAGATGSAAAAPVSSAELAAAFDRGPSRSGL
jgi:hypothetical protein